MSLCSTAWWLCMRHCYEQEITKKHRPLERTKEAAESDRHNKSSNHSNNSWAVGWTVRACMLVSVVVDKFLHFKVLMTKRNRGMTAWHDAVSVLATAMNGQWNRAWNITHWKLPVSPLGFDYTQMNVGSTFHFSEHLGSYFFPFSFTLNPLSFFPTAM